MQAVFQMFKVVAWVLVCFLCACSARLVEAPSDSTPPSSEEPVCGSASGAADLLNSGCDPRVYSYVVTCSNAVPDPGAEGSCYTPPVGEHAIMRELPDGAPVWCCK